MKVEELEKCLSTNKPKGIYILYGEEVFLLENCLKKIKKSFNQLLKGINYILVDDTNINQIIQDLETPAFGFEEKLIVARNTGLFKKESKRKGSALDSSQKNMSEKLNKYIVENIETINKSVVLVFIENEIDKNDLFKTIEKLGTICNFEYQKPVEIQKRIKAICDGYKVKIDSETSKYFIESCGTDMQELINEIRKLIEYVGKDGTIRKEDIDKLAIKKIESVIFDLTDNLGKKNVKEAIDVLRNLIIAKEPIQKILVTLYNHFKKLYLTKIAIKNCKDIASSLDLKANQIFLVNKYRMQAGLFKEVELRNILKQLSDLDYKYKIGLIDLNIGLESILCTYCS